MESAPSASDDLAYVLPMACFLAGTWIGAHWPDQFVTAYIVKTAAAAGLLILLRRHYTKIRWNYAWLGALVGIIGAAQWIDMEKGLLSVWPHYPRSASGGAFDPLTIPSPQTRVLFLTIRFAGPVLVVPFMEELFWRDYLWRTVYAPNNFKMADIGVWDWNAFLFVTFLFATVHVQWITAIVWCMMVSLLLIRTKSLGACIIAHAVTNLLLGVYVLYFHDWSFW